VLQGSELVPLSFFRHFAEVSEYAIETVSMKSLEHPRRPGHAPFSKGNVEPPGQLIGKPRQSPISKLRNHQRLIPAPQRIAIRTESPLWSRSQFRQPAIPLLNMIGHGVILVKIFNIRFHVEVAFARAVIHHQTPQCKSRFFIRSKVFRSHSRCEASFRLMPHDSFMMVCSTMQG